MNTFKTTIQISAPADRVWDAMIDVERWPEWTSSVTSVKKLKDTPLDVGSRVRIRQPRLLTAVWKVTKLDAGRGFTWVSRSPGVQTVASHIVEPAEQGCRVTLSVEFGGVFGRLASRVFGKLNEDYMQIEAAGLKRHCESSDFV
jgi:uncharacterized membrane protein